MSAINRRNDPTIDSEDFTKRVIIKEVHLRARLKELDKAIYNINNKSKQSNIKPPLDILIELRNELIPELINQYSYLDDIIEKMLEQLSAKKQENHVFLLESQMNQIEVQSYPTPSWPKILTVIGAGLLTSGTAIAGYTISGNILNNFMMFLIGTLYVVGLGSLVGSMVYLSFKEKERYKIYKRLFSEKKNPK